MAVPAHDERDFAFARRFGLPIRRVIAPAGTADDEALDDAYVAHSPDERLVNSGRFSGMTAPDGMRAIVDWLAEDGRAKPTVTYRLRDWLFSRQRYWGTPIPVIYCERDGIVPVPDEDLPVRLPDTVDYGGRGENPLNHDEAFLRVACPRCGEPARRETDTMDTFVEFVVVLVPLPVARQGATRRSTGRWWIGGRPSTSTPAAPSTPSCTSCTAGSGPRRCGTSAWSPRTSRSSACSTRARSWARDGERMSKSRGNVQDPDDLVARYGADTIRLFLMFMGPWDQGGPWSPTGIGGVHKFLGRVWTMALDPHGGGEAGGGALPAGEDVAAAEASIRGAAHRTLRVVTAEYGEFKFNTMVSHLMELSNSLPATAAPRWPAGGLGGGRPAPAPHAGARPRPTSPRSYGPGERRRRDASGARSTPSGGRWSIRRRSSTRPARSRSR